MNNAELKKLALKSLTEDISDSERAIIKSELITDYRFSDKFKERVIDIIDNNGLSLFDYDFVLKLNSLFKRVAITGMVAIIALIVSIFISQGTLSIDTIIGIDTTVDDGLLSLLIE